VILAVLIDFFIFLHFLHLSAKTVHDSLVPNLYVIFFPSCDFVCAML
jgi:hypothetical protein